jgi:hypothetical protein
MAQGVRKLVAVAGIGGEVHSLEQLFEAVSGNGADAVAFVGDLGAVEEGGHLLGHPNNEGGN